MKTSTLIAAIAVSFAAAGTAFAQEATYELPQPASSTVTRAQVQAQLAQARAEGNLLVTEADYQKGAPFESQFTRAEVKADTLAAIASGEVQLLNREQNSFSVSIPGATPQGAVRTAQAAR
ncbi:MAG: DUF4148 domain-containing protein [Burkholderiaceae bacterium]|jgi:hypothetical protein|nr:DUF4148 domain-containing protein [Burkholderiaceae bacterium]MCU0963726.1 DUF4148 domain-containing protein [Burkholderiaceae bacterium]